MILVILCSGCWISQAMRTKGGMKSQINWDKEVTFSYEDRRIIFEGYMGQNRRYVFDLGAHDANFMTQSDSIMLADHTKILKGGYVMGAGAKRMRVNYMSVDSFWTPLFVARHHFSMYLPEKAESKWCNFDGLIGRELYNDSMATIRLNMDNKTLTQWRQRPELDSTWKEVPIKIGLLGAIHTEISIEGWGKKKFLFDTGFSGNIILQKNPRLPDKGNWHAKGEILQPIGQTITDTLFGYEKSLDWNEIHICCQKIYYTNNTKMVDNIIGMEFIEQFNFIIDYKEKRMFLQERAQSESKPVGPTHLKIKRGAEGRAFFAAIYNTPVHQLFGFKVGDILTSIDHTPVEEDEDLCELNKRINEGLNLGTIQSISVLRGGENKDLSR